MKKTVKIPTPSTREYIQLFNGIFRLTEMEKNVLAEFLDLYLELKGQDNGSPFTSEMRKVIAKRVSKGDPHLLSVYIKKLKTKGALSPDPSSIYKINPVLIPGKEDEITFKFDKS